MTVTHDITSPKFWIDVSKGSSVTLTDIQTLKEDMKKGGGMDGINFSVKMVRRIKIKDLTEYFFFYLESPVRDLWLTVRMDESEPDNVILRVYFHNQEAVPLENRKGLMEKGFDWLFKRPKNPNNYKFSDLEYEDELSNDETTFEKKGFGELHGVCIPDASEKYLTNAIGTVVEYSSQDKDYENPELLIMEVGGREDGGAVHFLQGCDLTTSDIEVVRS